VNIAGKRMNTKQIENLLRADCSLSTTFDGVFASDRIPTLCDSRTAMVVNTDPHDRGGTHWVCMYIDNGVGEFFDSYGLQPYVANFIYFMRRNCGSSWRSNDMMMQSLDSDVCGHYCIWYLGERARGKSMEEIKRQFSPEDSRKNDTLVKQWVEERYGKIVERYAAASESEDGGQCCCSRSKWRNNNNNNYHEQTLY
jgi:hypothetical protein